MFNVFCSLFVCCCFLQLLKLRVVSDPDICRENYKIFFYHFYMIICHISSFSNGENFTVNAFPVFFKYSKKFIGDVISVVKCTLLDLVQIQKGK